MDIFRKIDIEKDYDVLLLSNIPEHAEDENDLIQARENIEALLRNGGVAIITIIKNQTNVLATKRINEILTSGSLELDDTPYRYYEPLCGKVIDFAYSYRKRKKS